MDFSAPRLIALDWNSSGLRACLLGDPGIALEERSSADGLSSIKDGLFADPVLSLCGDWIGDYGIPLIASGAVGNRQGWREAPYLPCPATLSDAAHQLTRVDVKPGVKLYIVPGLWCPSRADDAPDVMRGEETCVWGAALPSGHCCVLPGPHTRWVWTSQHDGIERFETHLTGELRDVLKQHSTVGSLMRHGTDSPAAFDRGVRLGLAEHANLTHLMFCARSAGLTGRETPEALPHFLFGLLVGAEIAGATRHRQPTHVTLIDDSAMSERYERALKLAGIATMHAPSDARMRGLWRLAEASGLVLD